MMVTTRSHFTIEAFMAVVQQAKESLELLQYLEIAKDQGKKCPPAASLIASYLISDLYSEQSSDEANINRITTNLEAAADDLVMLSKLIRSLGNGSSSSR